MKRIMLPVLIILVLMTPAVLAADRTATDSLFDATTLSISLANYDPNPAIAGDTVEVRIGVKNIGGMDITDLMMEIVPSYPFELVPGENAIQDVGIVQGYQSDSNANIKIVKYMMKINRDTSAGSYELKIKYYERSSIDVVQKSLYIDVKSRESAEVIHIDKSTLVPGKQSSLKFTTCKHVAESRTCKPCLNMETSSFKYTHEFADQWLKTYEAYKDFFNMWMEDLCSDPFIFS